MNSTAVTRPLHGTRIQTSQASPAYLPALQYQGLVLPHAVLYVHFDPDGRDWLCAVPVYPNKVWIESVPQEYMYASVALTLIFRSFGCMAARDVEGRLATLACKTVPLRATGD